MYMATRERQWFGCGNFLGVPESEEERLAREAREAREAEAERNRQKRTLYRELYRLFHNAVTMLDRGEALTPVYNGVMNRYINDYGMPPAVFNEVADMAEAEVYRQTAYEPRTNTAYLGQGR